MKLERRLAIFASVVLSGPQIVLADVPPPPLGGAGSPLAVAIGGLCVALALVGLVWRVRRRRDIAALSDDQPDRKK